MITTYDPSGILSLPLLVFAHDDLVEDVFRNVWANGEPLVVTGLQSRFDITWDPKYFIEKYGHEHCRIVECQSEVETDSTVRTFFEQFGKYEGRDGRLKLKVLLKPSTKVCISNVLLSRIGLQPRTSKHLSLNCSPISLMRFPYRITLDEMVQSTLRRISPPMPSPQISVCIAFDAFPRTEKGF